MKTRFFSIVIFSLILVGCKETKLIPNKDYLEYQPTEPLPSLKVKIFDKENIVEKEIYWGSIPDSLKRTLLPLQSAQVSIKKMDIDGSIGYLGAGISAERGIYIVTMDYIKYRVEEVFDQGEYIGNGRIGVGLRIEVKVITSKANLNLGSLSALGMAAKMNNLKGDITVDIIGIDSEQITNLLPLSSEIDQTSIQSTLQALASIKTKLWEDETAITPHFLAFQQYYPDKQDEIKEQMLSTSFSKTLSSEIIIHYLKPDGKNENSEHKEKLTQWMNGNVSDSGPGSVTMLIYGDYESLRQKAINDLEIKDNP